MKKILLLLACLSVGLLSAAGQGFDPADIAPSDPSVRTGTLPNGATYYIKHNAQPAERANFYIYYKVGAVQEEDNQNGLAHFLEHMAFNGSKHFPENTMIDYLSTIGVRFGENLNAYTGQEQTCYMILNVPLVRESITDSVLLILHDWAGYISLEGEDIDKERGVIIEEWRQGNNARRRIMEKQSPVLYNNSIYARRNVIGNPEILTTFSHDELRDFYHRWYRPDMQAFIIVGDFDPEEMEAKLRRAMADIPAPEVRTPRAEVTIPDNDRPLISVATDPELTMTSIQLLFRHEPQSAKVRSTYGGIRETYINQLVVNMLSERLSDIAQQPGAPFLGAGASYSAFVRPADVFFIGGTAREGEATETLEALWGELLRAKTYGFTASELERVKTAIRRYTERYYDNRNDRTHGEFVDYFIEHFENGTPYLSAETDLEVTGRVLDAISLEDVNRRIEELVDRRNSAILISMPQSDEFPAPDPVEVEATIEAAYRQPFEAYTDEVSDGDLLNPDELAGSPVVSEKEGRFGSTVLELGNSVRVIVKPTQLKADEIVMTSYQGGGSREQDNLTDRYNLAILPSYLGITGIAGFSNTELQKMLTGKLVSVSPSVGTLTQGFSGSSSPRDLETLFQLIYLYYTAPRFDESDWTVMMGQYRAMLPNVSRNPGYILRDSINSTVYGHDPRVFQTVSPKVLDAVSLEGVEKVYREFFSDAADMTFIFVGNISVDELRPLAEKYLGSLPTSPAEISFASLRDIPRPVEGMVENVYSTRMETPKVTALRVYSGELPYTLERSVMMSALRYILEMRYTTSIREEKGGTYGVGVGLSYRQQPTPLYLYQISFDTDPDKLDELLPLVQHEIDGLVESGVTAEELTKTKEFFIKSFRDGQIRNSTWLSYLNSYYYEHIDRYDGYEQIVAGLTSDSLRELAAEVFGSGNVVTVVQLPDGPAPIAAVEVDMPEVVR